MSSPSATTYADRLGERPGLIDGSTSSAIDWRLVPGGTSLTITP
ncbi:MAG TPA: hypothetical protein VFG97_05920 [Pedococcus sp.]|nr:hypothetical protein [Pedococcus sp.]